MGPPHGVGEQPAHRAGHRRAVLARVVVQDRDGRRRARERVRSRQLLAQPSPARPAADHERAAELRRRPLQRRVARPSRSWRRSWSRATSRSGRWRSRSEPQEMAEQAHAFGFCPTFPPTRTTCDERTIPFLLEFEQGRFPDAAYFSDQLPLLALQRGRSGQRPHEPTDAGPGRRRSGERRRPDAPPAGRGGPAIRRDAPSASTPPSSSASRSATTPRAP